MFTVILAHYIHPNAIAVHCYIQQILVNRMRDHRILTREYFSTKQFENYVEDIMKSVTMHCFLMTAFQSSSKHSKVVSIAAY